MRDKWVGFAVFTSGLLGGIASPITEGVIPRVLRVTAAVVGLGLTHLLWWLTDPNTFAKRLAAGGMSAKGLE